MKEAFEAVKAMDQQTIQARFTEDPLGDGQSEDVAAQQLVKHLSCQIVSCEQTADTAVATLQITNLDMQQVMDAYITGGAGGPVHQPGCRNRRNVGGGTGRAV